MAPITRSDLEALDARDPLGTFRGRFQLPEDVYLNGNSLGALPRRTIPLMQEDLDVVLQVVQQQWGQGLITSWNTHDWISLPHRVGSKLATLLGAKDNEVVACDSTSINVFKVVSAALNLRPDRTVIVSERENFPTDLYMLEGLIDVSGRKHQLVLLEDLRDLLTGGVDLSAVAAVLLTHVSYRTGRMLDMKAITAAVQRGGAIMVWDLAHSAGAVPVDLNEANADLAVGCGYKFLNGGPGAPAFLYVAERLQEAAKNPLSGWFGHKQAFEFEHSYRPADGISRFLCGTTPVLGLSALEVGVDLMLEADQQQLREKSMALGSVFLRLLEQECKKFGFKLFSPAEAEQRGSQINICHDQGYSIVQALIRRGVIGDYRSPDIIRLGFTPLYTTYVNIWEAIQALKQVMLLREWDCEAFRKKNAVT